MQVSIAACEDPVLRSPALVQVDHGPPGLELPVIVALLQASQHLPMCRNPSCSWLALGTCQWHPPCPTCSTGCPWAAAIGLPCWCCTHKGSLPPSLSPQCPCVRDPTTLVVLHWGAGKGDTEKSKRYTMFMQQAQSATIETLTGYSASNHTRWVEICMLGVAPGKLRCAARFDGCLRMA